MSEITAIIPAYNAASLLPDCLESILSQRHPVQDIIVVDDGSSDNTAEVASRYPVRCIRQQNKGLSGARNTGILAASTEWVAFLDADDRWFPHKIECQLAAAEEHPEAAILYSDASVFDSSGSCLGLFLSDKGPVSGWIFDRLLDSMFVLPSTVLARRDALITVGMFSERLRRVEDYDLWLRMAPEYQFHLVPDALISYNRQESSLSKNVEGMSRAEISVLLPLLQRKLTRKQRSSVRRRLAHNMFNLSYELRHKDRPESIRMAWECLRMKPTRPASWKLIAGRMLLR